MAQRPRDFTRLNHLVRLGDSPDEQTAYALELLATDKGLEVAQAALAVLAERPEPAARALLLERYAYCADNSKRRDPGGHVRAGVLRALRGVATILDMPLLERAAFTFEHTYFGEAASGIRAAAIVTLNELDPEIASYHAARLLVDLKNTQSMSGEPASTAARLLAANGQFLPLYAYAMLEPLGVPEAVAECLRSLVRLPAGLLNTVVAHHRAAEHDVIAIGLIDLLLEHPAGRRHHEFLLETLTTTYRYDLYRYLAAIIVAKRDEPLLKDLSRLASRETDRRKLDLLREAADARPGDPIVATLAEAVAKRLG